MPDDDQQQQQTPPINLADPAALTAAYQKYLEYLGQVGNQRPAQAPVISQAQLDANKPTSLLGQLGEALGGGAPSDVPMTSDQRERAGVRGLFNFSRGLLGTGTFDTIGQALDRGFTEAERGQYNQEAQVAYGQSAAQDWQRQQMADRLAALKESIPLLQGIQRLNMPSLYGPGGGPGAQAGGPGGGGVPGTPGAPGVATAFTGDKSKDLAMIKQRESGGDYGILNYVARQDPTAYARGATASGAYQIVNSTWKEGMQLAGLSAADQAKYPTASSAPPAVQDQVAGSLYDKYGTRPWDPSKFGANWVQQPGGGYQLVKGAPYTPPPGQVAQQPTATPAQPATKPPAASGGDDTAALPVPPREPPGAVPTVTTPEQATATATAAGTPVQMPGNQGLWALPGGGATSTPRLIMPGTDVASVTPTVPAAPGPQPPPGVVTSPQQPPPGVVTPAPQQPAPQQPPAPQAPDLKAQNPDGTYVTPDEKLSLPQFQDRYRHIYSPAELQQRGIVLPDNPTALQTAYAGVQEAEAEARAAHQTADMAQRGLIQGADAAKAIDAANGADKNAQAARQAYTTQIQQTNEKNASALQTAYQEQDKQLASAHKDILDRVAASALETQRGKQQIAQTDESQRIAYINSQQGKLDEEASKARENLWQLDMLHGLSEASGGANPIGEMDIGGRSVRDWLLSSGIGTQSQVAKWTAQDAFKAAITKFAQDMRAGQGMGRLTNQELTVLMQMLPNVGMDQGARDAILSYMGQVYQRKSDFALHTANHLSDLDQNGKPINFSSAMDAADKELGPIMPQVPPEASGSVAARDAWLSTLRPNTLFRNPDGKIALYRGQTPVGGQ